MAATVVIRYNGTDITDSVLFESTVFEAQLSAIPGTFELTVRDDGQSHDFVSGKEVTLDIDGVRFFGGYLTMVTRKLAFPVDDTVTGGASSVRTRQWVMRGVDYNILFDKRVLRNPSNYLSQIPSFAYNAYDGDLVRRMCANYLDIPSGFDTSSQVDNVSRVAPFTTSGVVAWKQQGTVWREQMEDFAQFSGAVWYIDAQKRLHWHALETQVSTWGFSDVPNKLAVVSPATYLPTYGFREMDATEDGSLIVNDALVWGGNPPPGGSGGVVFARDQNTTSIALHDRWQVGETHFGELGYGLQEGVNARASLIVEGSPSAAGDQLYGLKYPQWNFRFAWHDHNIPRVSGVPDYPRPGKFYPIILYMFGTDVAHPLIRSLPLRTVRITFPELKEDGKAYVRFDGFFGIQTSDPWTLWRFLLKNQNKTPPLLVTSVDNTSTSATYGAVGSFYVLEAPDGIRTTFTIPFPYLDGTTQVSLSGLFQRPNIEYIESAPELGQITFTTPPQSSDWIWVVCITSGT